MTKKSTFAGLLPAWCSWLHFLVGFYILTSVISLASCCSCTYEHPQNHFCSADFVIKAKIKRIKTLSVRPGSNDHGLKIPTQKQYFIRVCKIFKAHEAVMNTTFTNLYAPYSDGMCGLNLQKNVKYLITGTVHGGKLHTNLCNFVFPFDHLSVWQRKGFTRKYGPNCDCQVSMCFSSHCPPPQHDLDYNNHCTLDIQEDRKGCHMQHSYCRRAVGNESCSWSRTGMWRECHRAGKKRHFVEP